MNDEQITILGVNYALGILGKPPIIPYNKPYSFTITTARATGQTFLSKSGTFPTGIDFTDNGDGTGTFAGTSTDIGRKIVRITGIDQTRQPVFRDFVLEVAPQPISIPNPNPTYTPGGGLSPIPPPIYSGPGPFDYTQNGGTLPPGITGINGDGTFNGTVDPGTTGTYCVDVIIHDESGTVPDVTVHYCMTEGGGGPTYYDITSDTYWTGGWWYGNAGSADTNYQYTGTQWAPIGPMNGVPAGSGIYSDNALLRAWLDAATSVRLTLIPVNSFTQGQASSPDDWNVYFNENGPTSGLFNFAPGTVFVSGTNIIAEDIPANIVFQGSSDFRGFVVIDQKAGAFYNQFAGAVDCGFWTIGKVEVQASTPPPFSGTWTDISGNTYWNAPAGGTSGAQYSGGPTWTIGAENDSANDVHLTATAACVTASAGATALRMTVQTPSWRDDSYYGGGDLHFGPVASYATKSQTNTIGTIEVVTMSLSGGFTLNEAIEAIYYGSFGAYNPYDIIKIEVLV